MSSIYCKGVACITAVTGILYIATVTRGQSNAALAALTAPPVGAVTAATGTRLLSDDELRRECIRSGLETIQKRHTCAHRADELLRIVAQLTAREEVAA